MNIDDYVPLAMRTISPASDVDFKSRIETAQLGLSGEAGEITEKIKKWKFHGHDLDREALIKELGDIAWYFACGCYALGVPASEVLERNIQKLKDRYPEKFDTARSLMGIHRD